MTNTLKYIMLLASFGLLASDNKDEKREDGKYAVLEPKKAKRTVLDPYLLRDLQKVVAGYLDIYDYNIQKICDDSIAIGGNLVIVFSSNELYFLYFEEDKFKHMAASRENSANESYAEVSKNLLVINYNSLGKGYVCRLPNTRPEKVEDINNICNEIFNVIFPADLEEDDKRKKFAIRLLQYQFANVTLEKNNALSNANLINSENLYDLSKYISAIAISNDRRYLAINYESVFIYNHQDYFFTKTMPHEIVTRDFDFIEKIDNEIMVTKAERRPNTSIIEVWDLETKKLVYEKTYTITQKSTASPYSKVMAISPNNKYIIYKVTGTNCLSLLDLKTHKQKALFYVDKKTKKINPITTEFEWLKFSGNSSYIFAVIKDTLLGWHTETGELLFEKNKPAIVNDFESGTDFSQDGKYMVHWDENSEKVNNATSIGSILARDLHPYLSLTQNQGVVLMEEVEEENTKK